MSGMELTVTDVYGQFPYLEPLVDDMKDALKAYYPDATYRIEADTMLDGSGRIILFVYPHTDVDTAYARREEFMDAWMLPNHSSRGMGRLGFILEFEDELSRE